MSSFRYEYLFWEITAQTRTLFGRLLALELGVLGDHVFLPLDLAGGQVPHDLRHVAQRDPNLAGRVPLPEWEEVIQMLIKLYKCT